MNRIIFQIIMQASSIGKIPPMRPAKFNATPVPAHVEFPCGEVLTVETVRRRIYCRVVEWWNCTTAPIRALLERFDCVVTTFPISGSPRRRFCLE